MPPGNEESKDDVKAAESGGEKIVGPGGGSDGREGTGGHEAESHDRDDGDGVSAAGNDASAVEQQPGGGEHGLKAGALEQEGEEGSGDEGRKETERDFASGAGKEREATAVGFPDHGNEGDESGEKGFGEPDLQPGI